LALGGRNGRFLRISGLAGVGIRPGAYRRRRASRAGGGEDTPRVAEDAAPLVTEVLEYRPYEDGYLQLELRRYVRRDGSARERGPYWYFQFHEHGKRKKLYLDKKVTGDDRYRASVGCGLVLAWGTDGRETRRRR
jgi:hypothetical protein